MNDRQLEMDNILKYLQKIGLELNSNITKDTVYYYLTKGLLSNNDKGQISQFFPEFINYFKNKKNIHVFNSENWKYFCQFRNINNYESSTLFNPIKIYLSVSKDNIKDIGIKIFDFLEKNNIRHESKIASEVRCDDIVIRLYSKEDEEKLYKFIRRDESINNKLMKSNSFCFQKHNICFALDGHLSYNETLSKYIKNYINDANNKKNLASLNGFYNYITNIYNKVFINQEDIDNYIKTYINDKELRYFSKEEILVNYDQVTKLIILSIKEKEFSYFLQMVNECNNQDLIDEKEKKYKLLKEENIDEKVMYLNKAILETYKQYSLDQVIYAMQNALNGNFIGFTNNNNERTNLIHHLDKYTINQIIHLYSQGDINKYIEQVLKKSKDENILRKIIYLNEAIKETYLKYGLEQTLTAVYYAIVKGDFLYFTNNNHTRDNLNGNITGYDIKSIIDQYSDGDVSRYVDEQIKLIKENNNKKI